MYKTVTKKERMLYIKERTAGLRYVLYFEILIAVISLLTDTMILQGSSIFIALTVIPLMILITIFKLFVPANAFSKKLQITDGYLAERESATDSEGTSHLYAKAKTMDGSKKTKRKGIPFYMRSGQIPVRVFIYDNKAIDFMLTEESYEYHKNMKNN